MPFRLTPAATVVALLLLAPPAAAQDDRPSLGDALAARDGEASTCGLVAAGILEQAVASLRLDATAAQAGLVLAQAPFGAYRDLGCNVDLLRDMLDCTTAAWLRLRREAEPAADGTVAPLYAAAVRCAADPGL
ncbi:hypothetical protein [Caenispirillum bisanense]|uniref:Rap1a immunity protein domain-containing protein n=1 Tax=Caenispirillum bisanense TaxID=414052 RepID=A0A286GAF8_9PROT|nr:hypothetical protein [Caenispirillum bisanense]SOD92478.1 hypothetical protein SAMN05421508_102455 [Caenispirillum bisanense]